MNNQKAMTTEQHHIKQVCFKIETDIDLKKDELCEAIDMLAPEGNKVKVRRGKSVWEVVAMGAGKSNYYIGYFRGMTRTGKIHFFHYKQIIL